MGMSSGISSIFQYVSDPFVFISPDFLIKKINPSAEQLLNIVELDWLGAPYQNLLKVASDLPSNAEFHAKSEDLKSGWQIHAISEDSDHDSAGYALIFHQPTTQAADIDKLTLGSVLNQLPCHLYWKDKLGVYQGGNHSLAKLAGLESPGDLVGQTDFDLPWKSSAKKIQKHDRATVVANKVMSFQEVFPINGKEKIFLSIKAPLFDGENRLLGVSGALVDITNRQKIKTVLKKTKIVGGSEEGKISQLARDIMGTSAIKHGSPVDYIKSIKNYYESIIACMPGNVFWIDKNSVHLGCNDNVLNMLGLQSREEYSGLTYEEMAKVGGWKKGQAESFRDDDVKVMKTGNPMLNIEEPPIPDAEGSLVYFLSNRVPLRDDKKNIVGVVGISIDITARKKAEFALQKAKDDAEAAREKAEQASQAKSNFLAVMSHELRTPLNAILGLAQIIKNGDRIPEDKIHEYGETIQRSGKELLTLISDVLEYSRAEAGQLRIEEELVDVPDLVNGVREKLANKASSKGLSLIVNINEHLPRNMITDAQRLRQILTNLADNAIKYSREGTVEIAVGGKKNHDQQKFDVEFSIKDTGIGIPKEQQATIFDEFTQVSSDQAKQYARRHGGVGLGLSIVKRFVDQMGGKIDFNSEENKGTTFHCHFTFPLPADDRENAGKLKELSGTQLLFVDDSKVRREHWQRKLLSWGFRVVASTHARAMKEMSDSYDRGSAFPIVVTSRKRESEKLRALTQQMVGEPRFNDILHVAVFEGAATLSEAELRRCGYSTLIQNCHQPSDFVDPFLEAWHQHQRILAGGDEVSLVGRRILLVEDNQLNQRVAKLLLADLKCEIDVADDGEGALKKLSENTYDLVLMDVGLPDISGLEVTEKFRQAHPDSGLPIIALTAHALVEDKQRCFDAGMDDYAVKPLDADKLKNTIRRWVVQKHVDK